MDDLARSGMPAAASICVPLGCRDLPSSHDLKIKPMDNDLAMQAVKQQDLLQAKQTEMTHAADMCHEQVQQNASESRELMRSAASEIDRRGDNVVEDVRGALGPEAGEEFKQVVDTACEVMDKAQEAASALFRILKEGIKCTARDDQQRLADMSSDTAQTFEKFAAAMQQQNEKLTQGMCDALDNDRPNDGRAALRRAAEATEALKNRFHMEIARLNQQLEAVRAQPQGTEPLQPIAPEGRGSPYDRPLLRDVLQSVSPQEIDQWVERALTEDPDSSSVYLSDHVMRTIGRGQVGEVVAAELANHLHGHTIVSFKGDFEGTSRNGIDIVTLSPQGEVFLIDNKACKRNEVDRVSSLTGDRFEANKKLVLEELRQAHSDPGLHAVERFVLDAAIRAIESGSFRKVVTGANIYDVVPDRVSEKLGREHDVHFWDVMRVPNEVNNARRSR